MPITFQTSAIAVAQIFVMGAMGFYLVRCGIIHESGLKFLSFLSVNIFFPLFIFYQIIRNFDPAHMPGWWQFPLINVSLALTGLIVSSLVMLRHPRGHLKDGFLAVSSLNNGGYMPLLIVTSLPLAGWAGQIYTGVILTIIGFDICLWTLGVWLLTRGTSGRINFKNIFNPPLLGMLAAVILVFIFGHGFFPEVVLKPIKIIGDATLAVAMIVIGGNLGLTSLDKLDCAQVIGASLIKLVVLPLCALIVLSFFRFNPLFGFVVMLQSCMPSSITLSIIARNYETKNQDLINQCIFATHLLSMITIPLFLGLYGKLM